MWMSQRRQRVSKKSKRAYPKNNKKLNAYITQFMEIHRQEAYAQIVISTCHVVSCRQDIGSSVYLRDLTSTTGLIMAHHR